jgi:hypothetical protein
VTRTGFGGRFNEQGWQTLAGLTEGDRADVPEQIFDPREGLRFNFAACPAERTTTPSSGTAWTRRKTTTR